MKVCFWKSGKAGGGKIKSPLYCYNGEVLLFCLLNGLCRFCGKSNKNFYEFVAVL